MLLSFLHKYIHHVHFSVQLLGLFSFLKVKIAHPLPCSPMLSPQGSNARDLRDGSLIQADSLIGHIAK